MKMLNGWKITWFEKEYDLIQTFIFGWFHANLQGCTWYDCQFFLTVGRHIWGIQCLCVSPTKTCLVCLMLQFYTDSNRPKTNTINTFIAMLVYQKDILIYQRCILTWSSPPPIASWSPPLECHPSIVTGAAVGVVVMTGGALVPQGVAKGSKPKSLPKRWGWCLMIGQPQWFLMCDFFLWGWICGRQVIAFPAPHWFCDW